MHVTGSEGGIDQNNILVCLTPWCLHTDVQHGEVSTCFAEVCHGQARHARSVISDLDRVFSESAKEEEDTLTRSSFVDWVV